MANLAKHETKIEKAKDKARKKKEDHTKKNKIDEKI